MTWPEAAVQIAIILGLVLVMLAILGRGRR